MVSLADWNLDAVIVGAREVSSVWQWDDGTPFNVSWFGPGEPSGPGSCVQMFKLQGRYLADDTGCDYSCAYVCERNI